MCRFAVQYARAIANRWIVAKRCVLRSTSGKLLRLLYFLGSLRLFLAPIPFAFFGRSSRKWTVASRSPFHTSSLLFISRRDPLHNAHLRRPAERRGQKLTPNVTRFSIFFPLFYFYHFSFFLFATPFEFPTFSRLFLSKCQAITNMGQ